MKKILFYILGAVLLTACSQDEIVENTDTQAQQEVAFSLNVNSGEIGTRAGGTNEFPYIAKDTKAPLRIILEVYQAGAEAPIVRSVSNDATEAVYDAAQGFNFPGVRLLPGNDYTAVFWADFGDDFYNADDLRNIEQKQLNINVTEDMMTSTNTAHVADVMDAYSGQVDFTMDADGNVTVIDGASVTDPANIPVTLTRPLSKVMFCKMRLASEVVLSDDSNGWDEESYLFDLSVKRNAPSTIQLMYQENIYTTYDALKKQVVKTGAKRTTSPSLVIKDFTDFAGVYVANQIYVPTVTDYVFQDGTDANTKLVVFPKVVWNDAMLGTDAFMEDTDYWNGMKHFKNAGAAKYYGAGNSTDGGTLPFIINLTTAPNKLYRVAGDIQPLDVEDNVTRGLQFWEVRDASVIPTLSGTPGTPTELG